MTKIRGLEKADTLLVFARFPHRGKVKTRLAERVGKEFAFRLYQAMLFDTLQRYRRIADCRIVYLGDCNRGEALDLIRGWDLSPDYQVALQSEGDLGERMWQALSEVSSVSDRVVIVGSDAPTVPVEWVQQAFTKLEENPFVIGPVTDGGYYLIGLSELYKNPFEGIDWGTGSVLEETLSRVGSDNVHLLPDWYDVDLEQDLGLLFEALEHSPSGVPEKTARALLAWKQSGRSQ